MSAAGKLSQLVASASLASLFPNVQAAGSYGDDWQASLRPASFGGIPFGVLGAQLRVGRRNAVHEYPYRDRVYVEDMGRAARRILVSGFLVENAAYGGGAVIAQRDQLIAVCESPDAKTLIHPTLGSLVVSLLDSTFEERWDRGRVFEFTFSFIESGAKEFPQPAADTQSAVTTACSAADVALASDFSVVAGAALANGSAVVDMAVQTASSWGSIAVSVVADSTNLMSMVGVLAGPNGRFVGGRLRQLGSLPRSLTTASSVQQLLARGTQSRVGVSVASAQLVASAIGLSV